MCRPFVVERVDGPLERPEHDSRVPTREQPREACRARPYRTGRQFIIARMVARLSCKKRRRPRPGAPFACLPRSLEQDEKLAVPRRGRDVRALLNPGALALESPAAAHAAAARIRGGTHGPQRETGWRRLAAVAWGTCRARGEGHVI